MGNTNLTRSSNFSHDKNKYIDNLKSYSLFSLIIKSFNLKINVLFYLFRAKLKLPAAKPETRAKRNSLRAHMRRIDEEETSNDKNNHTSHKILK